jgi:phosphate transport system substrate-binding protein
MLRKLLAGSIAGLGLLAAACGGSAAPSQGNDVGRGNLTGAGATFPEPFYTKAFYAYNQKYSQVQVNYQAVGSGAGIQQFTNGTVDFGASDVPMTDAEVQAAGGADSLVQLPTTLGVVAIAYNLPAVPKLQLDGNTLVAIYMGAIKKWDDPALKALNPGVSLPSKDIGTVHRSDGSGTTYAFTDYLAKQPGDWKTKVGVAKSVSWPAGVGAKGNEGVANAIRQTEGSIGYVELAYVIQTKMQSALVKNKSGKFVQPTVDGATAAAAQARSVSPTNFSITDEPGDASYPITTFSWIILKKSQSDAAKGKAVVNLFRWLVSDGQTYGRDLQYAPLPKDVQGLSTNALKSISSNGSPILA